MDERLGEVEVRRALAEDEAGADVTTRLFGTRKERRMVGRFVAEQRLVVAGLPVVAEVFRQLDGAGRVEPHIPEGSWAERGTVIATVSGPGRALLAGERTALNFLQRLSAVATVTRRAADAVADTGAIITDTRKTTPGLRALEKYAVRIGGGVNHRFSLADQVLFKDNHWKLLADGSLRDVLSHTAPGIPVVVEVETEQQLDEALAAGVKRILVDNLPPERVAAWAKRCGRGVAIEASGGITPETAAEYARAGAKYISIGALSHSAGAMAITFEIDLAD